MSDKPLNDGKAECPSIPEEYRVSKSTLSSVCLDCMDYVDEGGVDCYNCGVDRLNKIQRR